MQFVDLSLGLYVFKCDYGDQFFVWHGSRHGISWHQMALVLDIGRERGKATRCTIDTGLYENDAVSIGPFARPLALSLALVILLMH